MIISRSIAPVLALLIVAALAACGADSTSAQLSQAAAQGRAVARTNGCAACHGSDGGGGVGPPFTGLFGSRVEFDDGTTAIADEAYVVESIVDPAARQTAGYELTMPATELSDAEVASLVAYIRELSADQDAADRP